MAIRMQQRRGTSEQWTLTNPILAEGEIGFETDNNQFKLGDGVNQWGDLPYFFNEDGISGTLGDYILLAEKGEADGVATLDSTGQVPASQLGNATVDLTGYATEAYADTAEADAISTASADATAKANAAQSAAESYADGLSVNYDVAGSAATAESNANTYTDDLIGDATVDGTSGNTVTDRISVAVSDLVSSAPEALDTLNELAAALGDDPNFATSTATLIGEKVAKSGDTMTGDLTLSGAPTSDLHAATKLYVDTEISSIDLSTKQDVVSGVSDTEIGYLDGVTSGIQTQLNSKAATTDVVSRTNGTVTTASTSSTVVRNITLSTSEPSGGTDGDVWLVYEA